jgi:flagellar protein FlaG
MLIQNVTGNSSPAPFASNGNAGSPVIAASPVADVPAVAPQYAAPPVPGTQTVQPTGSQLQSAVDKLNQAMQQTNTGVQFSIDQNTKSTLVKVVDTQTGETIKQIPSKEVIAVSEAIGQFQQGLLVKQKA